MENDIVEKIKKMIWANDLLDLSFNKETLDIITEDELSDPRNQLDIFNVSTRMTILTDLAKVLGTPFDQDIFLHENIYAGKYWAHRFDYDLMEATGDSPYLSTSDDQVGCVRPVIRNSLAIAQVLKKIIDSKKSPKKEKDNQILYITYGEYPQWAASKELQSTLENEFLENKLNPSGKIYTFPNYLNDLSNYINYTEYVYNNEKYIRVVANPYVFYGGGIHSTDVTLTNNTKVKKGNYVWIKVSPLRWLVDKKTKTAICENGLLPFKCCLFSLNLDYYLKNYMLHDIFFKTGRGLQKLYEPLFQQGILEQIEKSLNERNKKVSSIMQNINEELQNFSTNDREQEFLKRFMLVVKQVSQLKIQDKASLFYKELQDLASYYVQKMSEFKKYNVLDGVKLMIENDGYILTKCEMMLDDIEKRLFYEIKVDYLEVFYNSVLEETKMKGI